jgi:hypothetical protein
MHDVQSMQVLQSPCSLREEERGLRLRKHLLAVLVKEEVALLGILEDHIDASVFRNRIPKRDAVRIDEFGMNANLAFDEFELGLGRDMGQIYLYGWEITTLTA